ncbi:Collagen alpha-2(I) chain [Paramuricea clavata]|uniref:Collagen alpha-2(I) chain n=2 Tax=Paramuricea clavata TaxID=317549 RepID=A0A7D9J5P2_PARCT|nr:Collagen alpha-2(I) chain [Paramuricea clavata]
MQATREIVDMIDKMDGLTPSSAARSCRDIKLQDHDASDGVYWIDPDWGSHGNAFQARCKFTLQETCINSTKSNKDEKFVYADEIQVKFLRLLSVSVYQRITYHCKNSMAFDGKQNSINLIGENEIFNMNSRSKYRPMIIQDDCKISDGVWHKTIFEVRTPQKELLPIIKVKPFDTGLDKEYRIEAGGVCFVW